MKMQESPEDYLEAIYMLSLKQQHVRSIDVARHLGYSKPSVSVAMKRLRENSYVIMDDNGYLTLTEAGSVIAKRVYERHEIITQYLVQIGVDPETAQKDACRMEHVVSEETFQKIKEMCDKSSVKQNIAPINHRGVRL